MNQDL